MRGYRLAHREMSGRNTEWRLKIIPLEESQSGRAYEKVPNWKNEGSKLYSMQQYHCSAPNSIIQVSLVSAVFLVNEGAIKHPKPNFKLYEN